MRQYETALIFDAQLEETEFEGELNKVVAIIESNSGQIVKTDRWGVRKLAFPIRKRPQGYYTFLYYEAPPDTPQKIEKSLRINEFCLRFMTIVPEFPFEFEQKEAHPDQVAGSQTASRPVLSDDSQPQTDTPSEEVQDDTATQADNEEGKE